jgi:hypothetical protein
MFYQVVCDLCGDESAILPVAKSLHDCKPGPLSTRLEEHSPVPSGFKNRTIGQYEIMCCSKYECNRKFMFKSVACHCLYWLSLNNE